MQSGTLDYLQLYFPGLEQCQAQLNEWINGGKDEYINEVKNEFWIMAFIVNLGPPVQ